MADGNFNNLTVSGTSDLGGDVRVGGNLAVGDPGVGLIRTLSVTGAISSGGALSISGTIDGGALNITGPVDLGGAISGGSTLSVTGAISGGPLSITGPAGLEGDTDVHGNLHVAGTADLEGDTQVGGRLEVGSLALRVASADESEWPVLSAGAANRLDVAGALDISGDLDVAGTIRGILAAGAVGVDQLAAGAVTTAKIANKAVTLSKIADGVLPPNIGVTVVTGLQNGQSIPVPTGFQRSECVFFAALKFLIVDPNNPRTIYNCSADTAGKVNVSPDGSAVAVGVALAKKGGW